MGELFNAWRDHRKVKRLSNLVWSTQRLRDLGILFESKNGGIHLIVCGHIDYWPSTGKWIDRKDPRKQTRGIDALIRHIRSTSNA